MTPSPFCGKSAGHGAALPDRPVLWHPRTRIIGRRMPREDLVARLDARVERMWEDGLLGEVETLRADGIERGVTARRAIGLARRARAAASPAPDRFARTVADASASDSDRTDDEEDVEADPSDDASNEDGVRRMDFGDVGDAKEKTSEASGGAAEASEKSAERTSPGLGEDMSLEGIQQYISELQALHQKTGMALRTPNKRDARG